MASALTPHSPPEARDQDVDVDDNGIARRDMKEKTNKDGLATDSDSSDQDPPREFKEGGYGW